MHEEIYNKCHILSQRQDVILEAKRVLLNEDIDKMMSTTFTEYREDVNGKISTKECRQSLPWHDDEFWKEIPSLNNKVHNKGFDDSVSQIQYNGVVLLNQINEVKRRAQNFLSCSKQSQRDKNKLKMYFDLWHMHIVQKRDIKKVQTNGADHKNNNQKGKSDASANKSQVQQISREGAKEKPHFGIKFQSKPPPSEILKQHPLPNKMNSRNNTGSDKMCAESFKNRFKAQKNIIEEQKAKLDAQNQIIEELKLGIIKEDMLKSIDNSKVNIQEIFSRCSTKLKCVIIPHLDVVENERMKFMLKSRKAPKIVQKMERRALERALKREIILERKRFMEETKKRLTEEAIAKKHLQDEEEKKKNLQMIKERRQRELELEKIRQKNKQFFLGKLDISIAFHKTLLLKHYFRNLKMIHLESKANVIKSSQHYITKTLKNVMANWIEIIEIKYRIKYNTADCFCKRKILQTYMRFWKEVYRDSKRSLQVAEDFHDLCLQSNTFVYWHRYVCSEMVATQTKNIVADNHFNKWLLFHYFYQWRSLPAVLQLEKAKAAKKKRWREKVWEILPDYKPPGDDELYI